MALIRRCVIIAIPTVFVHLQVALRDSCYYYNYYHYWYHTIPYHTYVSKVSEILCVTIPDKAENNLLLLHHTGLERFSPAIVYYHYPTVHSMWWWYEWYGGIFRDERCRVLPSFRFLNFFKNSSTFSDVFVCCAGTFPFSSPDRRGAITHHTHTQKPRKSHSTHKLYFEFGNHHLRSYRYECTLPYNLKQC
jgi:hypothetical protein